MSISRDDAAVYLHSQYDNLAREIQQVATDASPDGYGPDIDQALRSLGFAEGDLATAAPADSQALLYHALCDYYALRRFARQLATKVDTGLSTQFALEGDRPRVFDNVMQMLEEASERLEDLGYPGGLPPELSTSRLAASFAVLASEYRNAYARLPLERY